MNKLSFFLFLILPFSAYADLSTLLQQRHSGYAYESEKSVSQADLVELAEAAKLAPSCYNDQPWRFIFTDREKTPEAYKKVLNTLAEGNRDWTKNAPVLVVVSAHSKFIRNKEPNRWGQYDTGAAAMVFVLKATSLGLMAHEMGGFDEKLLQQVFMIPQDFIPMAVIAVGYEKLGSVIPSKKRNPLEENFYWESWGSGMKP